MIIVFLFHLRSALIPILALPIAVIATFIPMYYLQISSNIMSLGGLALAIGVLVDASIVMVENGYRHLSEAQHEASLKGESVSEPERQRILLSAAKQVGRPIFFSLIIIVVSFLPVFLLESQEGRMFRPLAYTKSFAIAFSSVLAITVVPVLMVLFIRGKRLRPEERQPHLALLPGHLSAGDPMVPASSRADDRRQRDFPAAHDSAAVQDRQSVHAAAV